jgi:anti-sigma factor RsiW
MTTPDRGNGWAWSQIEAWVDGTLEAPDQTHMRAALEADPALRAAVGRAAEVHRALRHRAPAPLPAGLRRRLLAIPGAPTLRLAWVALPAAAMAGALVAAFVIFAPRLVAPPSDEQLAALQDFEVAMQYVRKSTRIANREVTNVVGTELREAVALSRESLDRNKQENGG